MSTPIRIILIIVCAFVLWFLVVNLARNVAEGATGGTGVSPRPAWSESADPSPSAR